MTPLADRKFAKYSYKDYCQWEKGRWELLAGVVYDMTPAPSRLHQEISMILSANFYGAARENGCKVYSAPFDVRLATDSAADDADVLTVVQPDISVICDLTKLDDRGCDGAPELIVEILSPATAAKDMKVKRDIYERAGVKEYWLVHPAEKLIMIYVASGNNQYGKAEIYSEDDIVCSSVLPSMRINLIDVFGLPVPKPSPI